MSKYNKHVIVVGSARSGTSWLGETLAQPYRYRMLFEPEQETRTKKGNLICDKWLTKETISPEAYRYLNQVFNNRVDCDWIAQNSNRKFKRHLWPFIPKKYIIKFVRCNLSANYMQEAFGIPIIHLIRNPYDVIQSQQRVKFPWLYDLSHFVKQDVLVNLIKNKFDYDITNFETLSDLERLTLRWCIENVIPLEVIELNTNMRVIVRYEDLYTDIKMFYRLCEQMGLEPITDLKNAYKLPSSKTHPKSTIIEGLKSLKSFSTSEYKTINAILDIFETKLYSRVADKS